MEQRVNIKFLVKLRKSATGTFQMLMDVYGVVYMPRTQALEWHKMFLKGRESCADDERPGRPRSSVTERNIENVRCVVRNDRTLGVRAIGEAANLDRESVRRIFTEELQMRKICAKVVLKVLSHEQDQCRKELCTDILERIDDDLNLLDLVIRSTSNAHS